MLKIRNDVGAISRPAAEHGDLLDVLSVVSLRAKVGLDVLDVLVDLHVIPVAHLLR